MQLHHYFLRLEWVSFRVSVGRKPFSRPPIPAPTQAQCTIPAVLGLRCLWAAPSAPSPHSVYQRLLEAAQRGSAFNSESADFVKQGLSEWVFFCFFCSFTGFFLSLVNFCVLYVFFFLCGVFRASLLPPLYHRLTRLGSGRPGLPAAGAGVRLPRPGGKGGVLPALRRRAGVGPADTAASAGVLDPRLTGA